MSLNEHIELNVGPPPVPKIAIVAMGALMVGVVTIVLFMKFGHLQSVTQEITPGQDLVINVKSATLYVPSDALTMAGVISFASLEPNLFTNTGEEPRWVRPQVVNIEYRKDDGTPYSHVTLSVPALICFKVAEKLWQDYTQHPNEYQVQYYAEEQNPPGWIVLPLSANSDQQQLCGQTDHFSIFALAMKPNEVIPVTGSTLTPTQTNAITPTARISTRVTATPTSTSDSDSSGFRATSVSTQAALTATQNALPATPILPTTVNLPTAVPTTVPTAIPTVVAPTVERPPTDPPPTDPPPTDPPPTDPPATDPPATDPPAATDPPVVP